MLAAAPEQSESAAGEEYEDGEDDSDDMAAEAGDAPAGPQPRRNSLPNDDRATYKAFTRSFDEEIDAEDLCDPEELTRLRQQLDQQLLPMHAVVAKLANRLQRRLLAQHAGQVLEIAVDDPGVLRDVDRPEALDG